MTITRPSTADLEVTTWHQPMCSRPRSAASSGETSTNISGCSSERYSRLRLIAPAVWCSVSRLTVKTNG